MQFRVFKATDEQRKRNKHRLGGGEVVVEDESGPVRITGFGLWSRRDGSPGEISVTFPADRKKPNERDNTDGGKAGDDYYEYVRAADESGKGVKAIRTGLIEAFKAQFPAEALKATAGTAAASAQAEAQ
jgi:hypothetical protein